MTNWKISKKEPWVENKIGKCLDIIKLINFYKRSGVKDVEIIEWIKRLEEATLNL